MAYELLSQIKKLNKQGAGCPNKSWGGLWLGWWGGCGWVGGKLKKN